MKIITTWHCTEILEDDGRSHSVRVVDLGRPGRGSDLRSENYSATDQSACPVSNAALAQGASLDVRFWREADMVISLSDVSF